MKNLIKLVSILLVSVMLIFVTTVNAADNTNDGFRELTLDSSNTNSNNTSSGNTNLENTNTNTNNTNTNNTNSNTNTNKNTNNSSMYNNTNKNSDLPKTGIEDSIPVVLLVVVFGISAVYAYRKINEYKNI